MVLIWLTLVHGIDGYRLDLGYHQCMALMVAINAWSWYG
jgi:hypothetical protein